jgi:hypothetical protein
MGKILVGYKFHEIVKGKVGVVDVSDEIFKGKVGVVDVSDKIFKGRVGVVDVSDEIFKGKYCAGNRKVFVPEGKLPDFGANILTFMEENPIQESRFFDESI